MRLTQRLTSERRATPCSAHRHLCEKNREEFPVFNAVQDLVCCRSFIAIGKNYIVAALILLARTPAQQGSGAE